jgi:hypothetical protein
LQNSSAANARSKVYRDSLYDYSHRRLACIDCKSFNSDQPLFDVAAQDALEHANDLCVIPGKSTYAAHITLLHRQE